LGLGLLAAAVVAAARAVQAEETGAKRAGRQIRAGIWCCLVRGERRGQPRPPATDSGRWRRKPPGPGRKATARLVLLALCRVSSVHASTNKTTPPHAACGQRQLLGSRPRGRGGRWGSCFVGHARPTGGAVPLWPPPRAIPPFHTHHGRRI
jgi:hypothetical protein